MPSLVPNESLIDEAKARATSLGAGFTLELDAMSVELSEVASPGPNACVDVIVCCKVDIVNTDTCHHSATHGPTDDAKVVTSGTSVFEYCEKTPGAVDACEAPCLSKPGVVVGRTAAEGMTNPTSQATVLK